MPGLSFPSQNALHHPCAIKPWPAANWPETRATAQASASPRPKEKALVLARSLHVRGAMLCLAQDEIDIGRANLLIKEQGAGSPDDRRETSRCAVEFGDTGATDVA